MRIKFYLILLFIGLCSAQENGYADFLSDKNWVIEINDTLINSNQLLSIKEGTYKFKARPQLSYSWPAIMVESEISILSGDTTFFQLSSEKSTVQTPNFLSNLPKTTSYKNLNYKPNSLGYPKLKTGLLITSIATSWLAFYFKRAADSNYRKYTYSSSQAGIKKYYDRATNFDNVSNLTLMVSAAALSGYIYIALTE